MLKQVLESCLEQSMNLYYYSPTEVNSDMEYCDSMFRWEGPVSEEARARQEKPNQIFKKNNV